MNKLLTAVMALSLVATLGFTPATVAGETYNVDGKYKQIKPARPLEQSDKVEVVDVFWYGCPHCFQFLPHMQEWEEGKPDYVVLRRLPAIFRDSWEIHARAYYTAEMLGRADELHTPLFRALHSENRPLSTRKSVRAFFAEHGVSEADFDNAYDSFTVDSKMRASEVMPRRWGVQGTPSVIVNGRYLISGRTAGGYDEMIKVIEALVEREHKLLSAQSN